MTESLNPPALMMGREVEKSSQSSAIKVASAHLADLDKVTKNVRQTTVEVEDFICFPPYTMIFSISEPKKRKSIFNPSKRLEKDLVKK